MKNKVITSDLQLLIEYFIAAEASKNSKQTVELEQLKRSYLKPSLTFSIGERTAQKYEYYRAALKSFEFSDVVSVTTIVLNFLIWLGTNYTKDGGLKIGLFSYPKVIGKIVELVVDLIAFVKSKKGVLPA